jgi:ABC-2 type transport system permease protein
MSGLGRFVSNVAAIAYKEWAVIRHDKALLSVVMVQPWMMFLIFGLALSNKPANVPWSVLDESRSALSRRLVAEIQATGYFLEAQAETSYAHARDQLQSGDLLAVLVLPQSLARDAERGGARVQVLLDGSDPLQAARVGGYITQVAQRIDPRMEARVTVDPDRAVRSAGPLDVRQRFWFNATLADREFFLAALAGMLLTNLCLSVMSLSLVGERESGTYEQMLAAPTRPIEIVLGKLVPFVGLSYALVVFSVVVPGLAFGIWPQGSLLALVLTTLPFVLASLGIGIFISTIAATSAQAVFLTMFFIMPSFVLSGVMMPYQFMPPGIRNVGQVVPLRWYQIALRRIIERGAGIWDTMGPTLAMFAIFAVLLALIRWRMKPRLG